MGDFDDEKHPRDDKGQFTEGGGGLSTWADRKSASEDAPPVGRRVLPGATSDWQAEYYSFGPNPDATHLKSVKLDKESLGTHLAWLLGEGERVAIDKIGAVMGNLKAEPGRMIVYRFGRGNTGLVNKNAGNLDGVVRHIDNAFEKQLGNADTLSAYSVPMPKEWTEYRELVTGSKRGR